MNWWESDPDAVPQGRAPALVPGVDPGVTLDEVEAERQRRASGGAPSAQFDISDQDLSDLRQVLPKSNIPPPTAAAGNWWESDPDAPVAANATEPADVVPSPAAVSQPAPGGILSGDPYAHHRPKPDVPIMDQVRPYAQALAQGATLGFADEITAGSAEVLERLGLLQERPYEERRQEHIRPLQEARDESLLQRGLLSLAEGTGGLTAGFGWPAALRKVIPGLPSMAAGPSPTGSMFADALGRTITMGARGGVQGGTYAAGTAEPGERIEAIPGGTGAGVAFGAAVPMAGGVLKGAWSGVKAATPSFRGPRTTAEKILAKDIADAGETPASILARARAGGLEGGPVIMLADLHPNFQARAQTVGDWSFCFTHHADCLA